MSSAPSELALPTIERVEESALRVQIRSLQNRLPAEELEQFRCKLHRNRGRNLALGTSCSGTDNFVWTVHIVLTESLKFFGFDLRQDDVPSVSQAWAVDKEPYVQQYLTSSSRPVTPVNVFADVADLGRLCAHCVASRSTVAVQRGAWRRMSDGAANRLGRFKC